MCTHILSIFFQKICTDFILVPMHITVKFIARMLASLEAPLVHPKHALSKVTQNERGSAISGVRCKAPTARLLADPFFMSVFSVPIAAILRHGHLEIGSNSIEHLRDGRVGQLVECNLDARTDLVDCEGTFLLLLPL